MIPPVNSEIAFHSTDIAYVVLAFALVLLNGFFVAAEFAIVKLRSTKVTQLSEENGWRGRILLRVHKNLDAYLSACQLGITLASLGLGWVGEPAFAELLAPLMQTLGVVSESVIRGVSFAIAFFIISYLHIVVGELAPKSLAIRQPSMVSLWTAFPLYIFYWLMYPAIYLLNASSNTLLKWAGSDQSHHNDAYYSRDELKLILHTSRAYGDEEASEEMRVVASAVEMGELEVVDWANSREDLVSLECNASLSEVMEVVRRSKYSRYPIYDPNSNGFIGVLHIKDLLLEMPMMGDDQESFAWKSLLHPVERVSKLMPMSDLLEEFRLGGSHFALVEEADHKVIGFITMEDVLEVLVGDIQDEHRKVERGVLVYQPGRLLVRGDTPLFKIERVLDINLDHITAETLAGFVYDTLNRLPEVEETIEAEGLHIVIKKMKGPKIMLAKVLKLND